jgi:hypothetical protein
MGGIPLNSITTTTTTTTTTTMIITIEEESHVDAILQTWGSSIDVLLSLTTMIDRHHHEGTLQDDATNVNDVIVLLFPSVLPVKTGNQLPGMNLAVKWRRTVHHSDHYHLHRHTWTEMTTFETNGPRTGSDDVDAKKAVAAVRNLVRNLMRAATSIGAGALPRVDRQTILAMMTDIADTVQMIAEGIEAEAVSAEAPIIEERRIVLEAVGVVESGRTVLVMMMMMVIRMSETAMWIATVNLNWGMMFETLGLHMLFAVYQ